MGVGGYFANISWEFVYLAYAASLLFAILFTFLAYENRYDLVGLKSEKKKGNVSINNKGSSFLQQVISFLNTSAGLQLTLFMIGIGIYNAAMTPYYIYGQHLFQSYGFSVTNIGVMYSIIQFSTGLIYLTAEKVSELASFKHLMYITLSVSSFLIFINVVNIKWVSLVVFFAVMIFPDVMDILIDDFIQKRIPSEMRATLLSMLNFVSSVFTTMGYLLIGYWLDIFPLSIAFALIGIIPILSLIPLSIYFRVSSTSKALLE